MRVCAFSYQKSFLKLLIFITGFSFLSPAHSMPGLKEIVKETIQEYFLPSGRKVESTKIESISYLTGQEYLVDVNVVAQAPFRQEYATYHCGIFIEKKNSTGDLFWKLNFVSCELRDYPNP